jgi:hypothetical protein|tara:strand:+ start:680 stop:853 length:174 start_codon:yes stop_codon:yes gene_type:complete
MDKMSFDSGFPIVALGNDKTGIALGCSNKHLRSPKGLYKISQGKTSVNGIFILSPKG